jgi:hypothetical protein
VLLTRSPLDSPSEDGGPVRLACLRYAASVCPEPGSNSPSNPKIVSQVWSFQLFGISLFDCKRASRRSPLQRFRVYPVGLPPVNPRPVRCDSASIAFAIGVPRLSRPPSLPTFSCPCVDASGRIPVESGLLRTFERSVVYKPPFYTVNTVICRLGTPFQRHTAPVPTLAAQRVSLGH